MPTNAEQLGSILSKALAIIDELENHPRPTYMLDGQMVSWGDYHTQQTNLVDWCRKQLAVESPFEEHSRGYT